LATGSAWFLAVLFALSAGEKGQSISHKAIGWHPLVVAAKPRIGMAAHHAFLVSFALDVLTVGGLLVAPNGAAPFVLVLIVVYTAVGAAALQAVGPSMGCQCLGKAFDAPGRQFFLIRNGLLLIVCLGLIGLQWTSDRTLAAGLVTAAQLLVLAAISRSFRLAASRDLAAIRA